jgi:hypothetical protein
MSILTVLDHYSAESCTLFHKKRYKNHTDYNGKNKIVYICRLYDSKSKESTKTARIIVFRNFTGYKINMRIKSVSMY